MDYFHYPIFYLTCCKCYQISERELDRQSIGHHMSHNILGWCTLQGCSPCCYCLPLPIAKNCLAEDLAYLQSYLVFPIIARADRLFTLYCGLKERLLWDEGLLIVSCTQPRPVLMISACHSRPTPLWLRGWLALKAMLVPECNSAAT